MKNICTGIFLSLQRSCIVLFQEYRYGAVEFFQTKELLFTQRSKYPCIYNTYRIFNQCFVFGMVGSGRQDRGTVMRSEEHTSELQSRPHLVCRLLLEKK